MLNQNFDVIPETSRMHTQTARVAPNPTPVLQPCVDKYASTKTEGKWMKRIGTNKVGRNRESVNMLLVAAAERCRLGRPCFLIGMYTCPRQFRIYSVELGLFKVKKVGAHVSTGM
jgi:hypothetical protein